MVSNTDAVDVDAHCGQTVPPIMNYYLLNSLVER